MTTPTAPARPAGIQKFGPGELRIGEAGSLIDVSSLVNGCTLTPAAQTADSTTKLSGYQRGGSTTTAWTLDGNVDTDAGSASGLWQLCYDLEGEEVEFEFTPEQATGVTVSGTVVLTPLGLGSDAYGNDLTSDFSWTCVGKPTVDRDA